MDDVGERGMCVCVVSGSISECPSKSSTSEGEMSIKVRYDWAYKRASREQVVGPGLAYTACNKLLHMRGGYIDSFGPRVGTG